MNVSLLLISDKNVISSDNWKTILVVVVGFVLISLGITALILAIKLRKRMDDTADALLEMTTMTTNNENNKNDNVDETRFVEVVNDRILVTIPNDNDSTQETRFVQALNQRLINLDRDYRETYRD